MPQFTVNLVLLCIFALSSSLRDGSKKFKLCCSKQTEVDKECKHRFCDFDAINQNNILFFLNTCRPRNLTVPLMWNCASSMVDHTQCCTKLGVDPSCLHYCNGTQPVPDDYIKHVYCLNNFNPIRNCFKQHLDKYANLFGDI